MKRIWLFLVVLLGMLSFLVSGSINLNANEKSEAEKEIAMDLYRALKEKHNFSQNLVIDFRNNPEVPIAFKKMNSNEFKAYLKGRRDSYFDALDIFKPYFPD